MYNAVHFSAECFPIAKAGGLGDVAGALPKYLNKAGIETCILLPKYNQKWVRENKSSSVWKGLMNGEHFHVNYSIEKCDDTGLGFDVFLVDIPDLLFRENIYGYDDDPLRFLFFQHAALDWICTWEQKPRILHCHDHHTGLITFMINHCYKFSSLHGIKTVFTIHNGLYMGAFGRDKSKFFPDFSYQSFGYLEWNEAINPLATGIKCCHRLTTVSRGYLDELKFQSGPLQNLYNQYWHKSTGIVNGIDSEIWNPKTDKNLEIKLKASLNDFKLKNKKAVCKATGLYSDLPLIIFIGRLVNEKGGELLSQAIHRYLSQNKNMNFYILGSGANYIEDQVRYLTGAYHHNVANYIGYNEALAHQLYAAADFLVMPSVIEPCGLNQMYAMRYATIPVVRAVGGLKDTVVDYGDYGGYGIRFNNATVDDIAYSFHRAAKLFENKPQLSAIRRHLTELNFSWEEAVKHYIEVYNT